MAEGGAAAAMGNVNTSDNWMVHFRDTMRGGKFLNNFRMAELHAKESPDRIWELETYGALFDRTKDGKISQRNFGGHEYPRLAHVGDRTGLELIRTLQQKIVSLQQEDKAEFGDYEARIRVFDETTITELLLDGDRIAGAFGYYRESGEFVLFEAPGGGAGHRRRRQVLQGDLELVGVHRRRPRARAARRRHADQHGVPPVPPDRHGLAAVGQGHPGHRVGPRRRRRAARTPRASGSCSTTSPTSSASSTRRPRRRPTAGTPTRTTTGARRSCCPATRSPARSTARSRPAAAPRPAASSSTSPRGCPPSEIRKRLPSMYHQFKELADVDITKQPMEVGPTCHYVMGGVEVDPDTAAAFGRVRGPVRGRRGLRRHARLQPARRQLAVRPAGLRQAGGRARGRVRRRRWAARPKVAAVRRRGGGGGGAGARCQPATAARTRTPCSRTCRR